MISRRMFLAGLAAMPIAAACARALSWMRRRDHDAIVIVGCGAAALMAATVLLRRGRRVLMLASGPFVPNGWRDVNPGAPDQPWESGAEPFFWYRMHQVGGKLTAWTAHAPRYSARDFTDAPKWSSDTEWPIAYDELAPHYARAEKLMGVVGRAEGNGELPDGAFADSPVLTPLESDLRRRLGARGVLLTPGRYAVGSCRVPRRFNGIDYIAGVLARHPRFALIPWSAARRVELAPDGRRIEAVVVHDQKSGRERAVPARRLVLAAGAIESTQILLTSATARHPGGLGNGSGMLGRNLCDHLLHKAVLHIDGDFGPDDSDLVSGGAYIARFNRTALPNPGVVGGYGVQLSSRQRRLGSADGRLRNDGWTCVLSIFGEMEPRADNRVELSSQVRPDGTRAPRMVCSRSANDLALLRAMREAIAFVFDGDRYRIESEETVAIGAAVHCTGTCRMGRDPRRSVADPFGRLHELPDIAVVDGGLFVTSPEKNPTLTIMAIASRCAERLADDLAA